METSVRWWTSRVVFVALALVVPLGAMLSLRAQDQPRKGDAEQSQLAQVVTDLVAPSDEPDAAPSPSPPADATGPRSAPATKATPAAEEQAEHRTASPRKSTKK